MKIMDDNEVLAVIGHEIGHVLHTDSKDAMKQAYLTSASKNAVGAANNTVAKLTDSQLGSLAETLASAQYSQSRRMRQTIMALSSVSRTVSILIVCIIRLINSWN